MEINKFKTVGIVADEDKFKLAAILFDEIIPINSEIKIPKNLLCKENIDFNKLNELMEYDKKKYKETDIKLLTDTILPNYFKYKKEIEKEKVKEILYSIFQEGYNKATNLKILEYSKQINNSNTIGIPIFNESILLNRIFEEYQEQQITDKIEVELLNAPIICIDSIEWQQISEAKNDQDFVQKVKRFGMFINTNYQGKSINYIADDLSLQVENYKNACKKHGIKMLNGTLKTLSNSKSLFGTLGLVLCSIIFKTPEMALATGVIGGTLELANLSVTIKEYRDSFHSFTKEAPISLIVDLEKLKKK